MDEQILVIKASGEKVPFSVEKLEQSLHRVGADNSLIDQIIDTLRPRLYSGISTKKIYRLAFGLLKKASKPHAQNSFRFL